MRFKNTLVVLVVVTLCIILRICLWDEIKVVRAESCPTPHSTFHHGPMTDQVYYYYVDQMASNTRNGMKDAFATWSDRNTDGSNCSKVQFFGVGGSYPEPQNNSTIYCYTASTIPFPDVGPDAAGATRCERVACPMSSGTKYWPAKCKIYLKYPSDLIRDDGAYFTTFQTGIRKFSAHEVGHVMGLADQPKPHRQHYSIMNFGSGVNDGGSSNSSNFGLLPWNPPAPTSCDHQGITCWSCPTPTPSPTPGPDCQDFIVDVRPERIDGCWYNIYTWERWCDGVFITWYETVEFWYCEEL